MKLSCALITNLDSPDLIVEAETLATNGFGSRIHEHLRARVAEYEAGGVTELVYQPAGPDVAGELARMMNAVGSASS